MQRLELTCSLIIGHGSELALKGQRSNKSRSGVMLLGRRLVAFRRTGCPKPSIRALIELCLEFVFPMVWKSPIVLLIRWVQQECSCDNRYLGQGEGLQLGGTQSGMRAGDCYVLGHGILGKLIKPWILYYHGQRHPIKYGRSMSVRDKKGV